MKLNKYIVVLNFMLTFLFSCHKEEPSFKELSPAHKQTLVNLSSKSLSDLKNTEYDEATKILTMFFIDYVNHQIWYKNKEYATAVKDSEDSCKSSRNSADSKSVNSSKVKDNLKKLSQVFFLDLKNYKAIDIYETFIAYATKDRDLASVSCGNMEEAFSIEKESIRKYFDNDRLKAETFPQIIPSINKYLLDSIE